MRSLSPISPATTKLLPQQQEVAKKLSISDDIRRKVSVPESRTEFERQAEQLLGPNRLTMLFANPGSELFLAMLARAVVFLISGRSNPPDKGVEMPKDFDPSQCSLSDLLDIRQTRV